MASLTFWFNTIRKDFGLTKALYWAVGMSVSSYYRTCFYEADVFGLSYEWLMSSFQHLEDNPNQFNASATYACCEWDLP